MAQTFAALGTTNFTTARTSHAFTPTTPPTAGRAWRLALVNNGTATIIAPTAVTGGGLTWVKEQEQLFSSNTRILSVWRGTGVPDGSAITLDWGATSVGGGVAIFVEITGGSGTTAQGAVVGFSNGTTTPSVSLATAPAADSAVLACLGLSASSTTATAGAGYAEVATATASGLERLSIEAADPGAQSAGWTISTGVNSAVIALELTAAASGGSGAAPRRSRASLYRALGLA